MLLKNGKRMTKSDAKRALATTIAKIELGCFTDKTTGEKLSLNNLAQKFVDKIQTEMNEYGFSRRSIHDTVTCLMVNFSESQIKDIHDFCYGILVDGKKA